MLKRKTSKQDVAEKSVKLRKSDANIKTESYDGDEKPFVLEVKKLLKNQDTLLSGLTKLRDALKRNNGFSLFVEFVKDNSECPELYKPLDKGRQDQPPLELQIALEVLEKLLLFTADNTSYSAVGMYHVRKILQHHLKLLYSCLNPTCHFNMIKGALRLLVAMVTQGASAAREVVAVFDFTLKAFGSLVYKRDPKNCDSIRSYFITFTMSFLMFGDDATVRHILDVKGFISSIFKLLPSDPPHVVVMVLKTLHHKVVYSTQVPKKTKVKFFNSYVLTQLSCLYKYNQDQQDGDKQNVKEVTNGVLQNICCTFKYGICFANKLGMFSGRSNNPVLLRFLQSLPKYDHEAYLQQLVIKILACCPDLVEPYLAHLKTTYEPRLSLPWLANINFIIKLYSALPLPSMMINRANVELNNESFLESALYTVLPSVLTRMNLNQGIQHSSLLVKNTTLAVMILVLNRATDLVESCKNDLPFLKVDSFVELLTDILIKALPDIKTVISLRQNMMASIDLSNSSACDKEENLKDSLSVQCRHSLLLSRVVQVLYAYQKVQPFILSSLSFDLGKLLPGQQELRDNVFPPVMQYYTLKILLDLPRGTYKWYQQKSKRGPSNMYSILKMLVTSNNTKVKSVAESLITKFLLDEGIVSERSCEIDIWLKHLYSKTFSADQESLLLFLDSVCYSVAMEPYTYTDIVMEMTSHAHQANGHLSSFLEESVNTIPRVTFSPLVVKALMSHIHMVSSSNDDYTAKQLGTIAQYINLVVLDVLRVMIDPLPLMFTVRRFYGDIQLPRELSSLHNTHQSLLQYVCRWIGRPTKQVSEHQEKEDTSAKMLLEALFQNPEPSSEDLVELLRRLNEGQLCQSLVPLLQLCSSNFEGDVSNLVDYLSTAPYCLTGSGPVNEAFFVLLKKLPFTSLVWQVFGPLIINYASSVTPGKNDYEVVSHPGIQALVIDSLQREDTLCYPALCNHLLHYLSVFVSVTHDKDGVTFVQENNFMAAFALVFQLLELMIDNLSHSLNKVSRYCPDKTDIQEQEFTSNDARCVTVIKGGMRDFCKALLGHPVLYKCFVRKQEAKGQAAISSGLMLCISNIIRSIIDKVDVEVTLIKPYMDIICDNVVIDISKAQQGQETSWDGQALQMLQVFSSYCDQQNLSKAITTLLELPLDKLVYQNQASGTMEPTLFYQALLSLLSAHQRPAHVNVTANQESSSRGVRPTTNTDESTISHVTFGFNQSSFKLSVPNFERLAELAMTFCSSQLDDIVHNLIRTSPKFLLIVKPSLLDFCLDNVTKDRISIATTLISSSVCLRKHFERRCIPSHGDILPLKLDNLVDFLPLVKSYLSYAVRDDLIENEALRFMVDKYWSFLWSWLLEPKRGDCSPESPNCLVLELLIRMKASDTQDLKDKLISLLDLVPEQAWNSCQISIVHTILKNLLNNSGDDSNSLVWNTVSVCMANVSTTLSRDSGRCSTADMTLQMLHDVIATNTNQLDKFDKDSGVDADTWATFVKSCLKYNFDCVMTFKCMTACIKPLYTTIQRKPIINALPLTMMYELILTHSKFLEVIMDEKTSHQEAVLSLVVAIAEMSPECCQHSHLPVLFAAYNASLSKSDQMLLYLLHLYERAQVTLSSHRPYLWGKAALDHHKVIKMQGPSLWQQPSTNQVLELLDELMVNRSAQQFPLERRLRPRVQSDMNPAFYDPCFLIPLFCHLLSPNSEVDCRKFVERGGLGYTVAALSSRDEPMRKAASHVLSRYLTHLEASSFREKKQVHLLLVTFKNGIGDVNARVSSVITRFISRAAYVMLHPEHQMYFLLNSFLLQRAVMDLREVPLFYTLFNSSSLQHCSERIWMLGLLQEGLRDAQDYYVYKKRHVMELAMSFHDSQLSDQQSRKLVIGLAGAALTVHSAAFDLARNYGIVGWIHSLCFRWEEKSTSTSLRLLHTLWFTIQHGKPGACDSVVSGEELNHKPFPPNLAQETLLVCKTFMKYLSCNIGLADIPLLFELLHSVLSYLGQSSPQGSQLTPKDLLCLITQWSMVFEEDKALATLMNEVGLTTDDDHHINVPSYNNSKYAAYKTITRDQLVDVIAACPVLNNADDSSDVIALLACNFALEFGPNPSKSRDTCHHDVVTWFRRCLATNPSLQKLVLSQKGEHCLQRLLFLYGFTHDVVLIQELNTIFMTLLSRVQHVGNDVLGSSANKVAELLLSDVYNELMTSGLVKVLFPLCPSPLSDISQEDEVTDVAVTELMCVFLQDLWFGQLVPSHFLDIVVTSTNHVTKKLSIFLNGSTKIQSLLQTHGLGGT